MKRIVSLLLTLVLALLLVGCGGKAAAGDSAAQSADSESGGYWNTTADADYSTDYTAEEPGASAYNDSEEESVRPAKRIYTGYMEMQTLDFDAASSGIDALVKELGGYFQQSSTSNRSSGYRYGSYIIRVPAEQFDTFFQKAGELCHVTYSNAETDDVSESYYDTQARLETARIKLERLQTLLAKATSMDDIITIESAISDTEYEIESLSGTLRHYDALVDYATVSLTLSETYKLDENEGAPLTFGARIARAFTNGLRDTGVFLEDLAIGIANNLVFLAVLAALAVVVVRAVRKKKPFGRLGKKKSKLPAGEEPKSEE